MDLPNPPAQDATPEDILSSISFEIEQTGKSSEQLAKAKLRSATALASDVIISIMLYDADSKTRLRAAELVHNRVFGTGANTKPLSDEAQGMYNEIFKKIVAGIDDA